MIHLLKECTAVLTDSGGLQKEAFFHKKQCVTLRDETEWIELVENEFNTVAGNDPERIVNSLETSLSKKVNFDIELYGDGKSSEKIVAEILK